MSKKVEVVEQVDAKKHRMGPSAVVKLARSVNELWVAKAHRTDRELDLLYRCDWADSYGTFTGATASRAKSLISLKKSHLLCQLHKSLVQRTGSTPHSRFACFLESGTF